MAIDPGISLAVRPLQMASPLDRLHKAVSISDMLSNMEGRQVRTATENYALQQAKAKQMDQDAIESAIGQHASVDEDGLVTVDHKSVMGGLNPTQRAKYQALIPQLDKEALDHSTDRLTMRHQAIQSQLALATEARAQLEAAPDDASKQQAWATMLPQWVKADPAGAQRLPQQYSAEAVDPILAGVIAHGQAENDKTLTSLQIAQAKKDVADAALTASKIQPSTPEGMLAKATRMADVTNQIIQKYPNIDPERMDAILENVGLPKVARKAPAKPIPVSGPDIPEDAVDFEGKAIPDDWRKPGARVLLKRESGKEYYQITTPEKKTTSQLEHDRTNRLYAFSIGKKPEDLTPGDEAKAEVWKAKLTPTKATEFDKRLALYQREPSIYTALFGHGGDNAEKPITPAQKATILGRINTEITRQGLTGKEATDFRDERLAELKDAGVAMETPKKTAAGPTPTPMVRTTNKPRAGTIIDPAGKEHQVTDIDAAIKLHPGTREKK